MKHDFSLMKVWHNLGRPDSTCSFLSQRNLDRLTQGCHEILTLPASSNARKWHLVSSVKCDTNHPRPWFIKMIVHCVRWFSHCYSFGNPKRLVYMWTPSKTLDRKMWKTCKSELLGFLNQISGILSSHVPYLIARQPASGASKVTPPITRAQGETTPMAEIVNSLYPWESSLIQI